MSTRRSTISFSTFLYPPRSTLFPYTTLFRSCVSTETTSRRVARSSPTSPTPSSPRPTPWTAARARSPSSPPQESEQHPRSEEHTSELQSRGHLVCRLLLEKKTQNQTTSREVY